MKKKIAIALSGGVDSTVAAYLLKRQGCEVIGIHFITGYGPVGERAGVLEGTDDFSAAREAALRQLLPIAKIIDIPIEVIDIRCEFEETIVAYFVRTYQAGRTPNPCIVCNPLIKFGFLFKAAQKLGATALATGHYASVIRDETGRFHLFKGVDPEKEQSYFLSRLEKNHLSRARFPLAKMTKPQVIQIAKEKGFLTFVKKESQNICFVGQKPYARFLIQKAGIKPKPGPIVDMKGHRIGEHMGVHLFTIGQRRGINCPAEKPFYVVRIDTRNNRLVVGDKKDLLAWECKVEDIRWIQDPPSSPVTVETKVRYRHKAAPCILIPIDKKSALIRFKKPQSAVTPGQCAAFYSGEEVLGSGWIEQTTAPEAG
ncbi:MAG: tRNA 2-thiouridine(34) synthase MnmA [Deltaproteobacteria bacterium]|nr:tRNA 2-thiouridine(34) synthase MnmA [Deltaproteobacteria bacterium]MBW1961761.1 tRNA 2-thiouridine(34) synthase MnmA [Deltaproteobacteria bacterium]MBW2152183.1 tRNA 2-thiouridine(34) synthase MnmA [Deltaproteobacteria bacterium]